MHITGHHPPHELLTPAEAADLLRTTADTLAVWRCTGRHGIPFVKIGRSVRYRRTELIEWLDSRAAVQTGAAAK